MKGTAWWAYAACPAALLVLPAAMQTSEMDAFRAEASLYSAGPVSTGVRELNEIARLQVSERRRAFRLGKINTRLLHIDRDATSHSHTVEIEAVSPCDADVAAFLREVASRRPSSAKERWSMPFDENDVSVALWLSAGTHRVLLGADLKRHQDEQRGWGAVLGSPVRLNGQAGVFKVAHHGAVNAQHSGVWSTLLDEERIAVTGAKPRAM